MVMLAVPSKKQRRKRQITFLDTIVLLKNEPGLLFSFAAIRYPGEPEPSSACLYLLPSKPPYERSILRCRDLTFKTQSPSCNSAPHIATPFLLQKASITQITKLSSAGAANYIYTKFATFLSRKPQNFVGIPSFWPDILPVFMCSCWLGLRCGKCPFSCIRIRLGMLRMESEFPCFWMAFRIKYTY